jgi:hypothetical protein
VVKLQKPVQLQMAVVPAAAKLYRVPAVLVTELATPKTTVCAALNVSRYAPPADTNTTTVFGIRVVGIIAGVAKTKIKKKKLR